VTDLSELVPSLQRVVAPPGSFATYYPDAGEGDMTGLLMDGMAQAMLDGFFNHTLAWTDEGITTPDLTRGQQALVVIYAGDIMLRAAILQTNTSQRYKAGPVEYEVQNGASVLVELLKENAARKKALIDQQSLLGADSAFTMADLYFLNAVGSGRYYDYPVR
jgi:hypothetical protein